MWISFVQTRVVCTKSATEGVTKVLFSRVADKVSLESRCKNHLFAVYPFNSLYSRNPNDPLGTLCPTTGFVNKGERANYGWCLFRFKVSHLRPQYTGFVMFACSDTFTNGCVIAKLFEFLGIRLIDFKSKGMRCHL